MKTDILLSTNRIVSHKPYLSNGIPNGATEAFILQKVTINGVTFETHKEMTSDEWAEYCNLTRLKN